MDNSIENSLRKNTRPHVSKKSLPQAHFPQGDYSITVEEDLLDDGVNNTSQSHLSSANMNNDSGNIEHTQRIAIQRQLQLQQQQQIQQQQQQIRQQEIQKELNASLNTSLHLPTGRGGLNDSSSFPSETQQKQTDGALYESVDFPIASTQVTKPAATGITSSINTGMVLMDSADIPSLLQGSSNTLFDSVDFPLAQQSNAQAGINMQQYLLNESVDFPMAVTHTTNLLGVQQQGQVLDESLCSNQTPLFEEVDVNDICQNSDDDVDEDAITKYLKELEFPAGLIETIIENRKSTAKHYWVIDNSGSMLQNDGLRFAIKKGSPPVLVPCTRWKELQESVLHHASMVGNIGYVTQFMLLNKPGLGVTQTKFTVGENKKTLQEDIRMARKLLSTDPDGVSLITKGLRSLQGELHALAPTVSEQGKKIYFVLATDGLPSDKFGQTNAAATEQLMEVLRDFESYPVFIVIRLCTTDEETVEFYNGLDKILERNVEVIMDIHSEAEEISKMNPWINYSLPLHWSREMGLRDRLFDIIDERALTKEEMFDFLKLLFGRRVTENLPDPLHDWTEFHARLTRIVQNEGFAWDPTSKKLKHWVDLKALDKIYGNKKRTSFTRAHSGVSISGESHVDEADSRCKCLIS